MVPSRSGHKASVEKSRALPFSGKILKQVLIFLALTAAYVATSKLGFTMAFVAEQVTVVWPPTGIALAAVLLWGFRVWPAIALGAFLTNITANEPALTAMGIAAGNTLEAVAGAWMMRRAGFDNSLNRVRDVLALILFSATLSTMISATIGAASLCLSGLQPWESYGHLWITWWLGDAGGALIVAPFILAWAKRFDPALPWRTVAESGLLAGAFVLTCVFVFMDSPVFGEAGRTFIYVVFPFLIWASLRFGQRGTTFITLAAAGIAIWATLNGLGPFRTAPVHQSLMLLESFMAIVASTGLFLSAAISERQKAEKDAREGEGHLRELGAIVESSETERTQLIARLQESGRRKDEFLAMLAHELRNPLAPIRNALNVMRLSKNEPRRKEAQSLIERQLAQMVRLVDDLMDVSRITRGKIEMRKETARLDDIITSAVEMAKPLIEERRQKLGIKLPPEPIFLNADPMRLSQVFANLLNNAAKYTNEGGAIELKAVQEGEETIITVRDNGIGIPPGTLPHIFDMFMQTDNALGQTQGGLGIGLTLVKNLVALHGGSVSVKSEGTGRGSEFIVRLPALPARKDAPPPSRTEEQDNRAEGSAAYRILIVDDNKDSAQTLGWMMELLGHEPHLAHDGPAGIALAERLHPGIVLLDIGLPGMNGYDVCIALKKNPALKNTVFIAQTGWSQAEYIKRSKEAGFDHHLVKPLEIEILRGILESLAHPRPNKPGALHKTKNII